MSQEDGPDPKSMPLQQWLKSVGTRSGTFTFNGVTYRDLAEVEWRTSNREWR